MAAAKECMKSSEGVEIIALADVFQDKIDTTLNKLRRDKDLGAKYIKVTEETCFTGFDAYKKLLACDVDLVLLETPPGFRAEHLRACIEAGKNVFLEKPATVDPVGARSYRGGPSRRNAARTVFFEQPNRRAICLIGMSSARCSRRISAQSSTLNTEHDPGFRTRVVW